ncbi:MAG: DUF1566 domain-containing protein [Campylobacterota bacterium]|nr:DUF1566 domain-containing protein [Campylobacterota bacterium]
MLTTIVFFTFSIKLNAQTFQWGETIKIDITKNQVDAIIKKYVDKNDPKAVEEYKYSLKDIKIKKIEKYSDVTFVNDNLMWEDQQIISKDMNILESKIYCRKLKLANKNDWRVPRYDELLSIANYSKSNRVSLDKIKYIDSDKYWSISQKNDDKNKYWYVDFKNGASSFEFKNNRNSIRCVRDISKNKDDFEKKINIVIDKKQNIMWQDNLETVEHIETVTMAKVYCDTLILNGYIDWKMADIKQLQSIIDVTQKSPTIKKQFKYTKADKYWSNVSDVSNKKNHWYIDFKNGEVNTSSYDKEYLVRCLREIK